MSNPDSDRLFIQIYREMTLAELVKHAQESFPGLDLSEIKISFSPDNLGVQRVLEQNDRPRLLG